MRNLKAHSGIRNSLTSIAIAAVLGLAAIGLSQCRMVDENVTGVSVDRSEQSLSSRKSKCVKRCNHDFEEAMDKEDHRYKQALRECKKNRHDDDKDKDGKKDDDKGSKGRDKDREAERECRKEAKAEHRKVVKGLEQAKHDCKAACAYREGSGKGGK